MYINCEEIRVGFPVFLKIFHMTKLNSILQCIGIGIYHTAIEVKGYQYSYGSTEDEGSGVYMNEINEDDANNTLTLKGI